jgi:DNA-binding NtrC family response regulator
MTDGHTSTSEIPAVERSLPLSVEVQDDSGGRTVPIADTPILVGSSTRATLVVADPTVSALHLELSATRGGVRIVDADSRNGTFVGGARVREAWGGAGTTVNVGCSTLTIRSLLSTPDEEPDAEALPGVIGSSLEMRCVAAKVRRLAARRAPVLVLGESGTGKELVSRALHQQGPRAGRAFVALNVSAMPSELVESELFGHERGAFTGAIARRAGAFAEADGGTLFLDEIGDLPLEVQPKLLRALDGYEVRRVGGAGHGTRSAARVIAATNVALDQLVEEGRFRRDLFHRLEVFVVRVPPLRERRGDVCAIARHVVSRLEGDGPDRLTTAALSSLASHPWPGNVRELGNVLARAADLARAAPAIDVGHIELAMGRAASPAGVTPSLAKTILRDHGGNMSSAARAAGVPRTTFRKLIAR